MTVSETALCADMREPKNPDNGTITQPFGTQAYWLERERRAQARGSRIDPMGALKFLEKVGRMPGGYVLDGRAAVYDPDWKPQK